MTEQDAATTEQPLVAHLIELRNRLMRMVLIVLVLFVALVSFANDIYSLLAAPLLVHLPDGASMIATEVASPFLTPFKLTFVLSVTLAMPLLLYQIWGFVAPGLYRHERGLVMPLMISSTLLFYAGMAFAYFVVFPLVFGFFTSAAPQGVTVMTDIAKYLDFVLKMFLAFGLAFEVPIATILLVRTGISTRAGLAQKRPYIIVVAFVIGMLLTPPDIFSQTLLALPMLVLFEAGLFFARMFEPPSDEDVAADPADAQAAPPAEYGPSPTAPVTDPYPGVVDHPIADENSILGDEYEQLSDEDMEAELDRLEAEERELEQKADRSSDKPDTP